MANTTPLSATLAAAVISDTELTDKARQLAHKVINMADDLLTNGSPRTQMDVIKSLMPAIAKGLQGKSESEDLADMRATLTALMQHVIGEDVA